MPHRAVSAWPGAVIVPLIDVLGIPVQAICCKHWPLVQVGPAHVFATPPPPQVWPEGQVPQLGVSPPQPSPTTPQVAPAWRQVRGVHDPLPLPPHVNSAPPPPQVAGGVHVPQSITLPQPSPTGPHVAFWDAHVDRPQPALPSPDDVLVSTSPSDGAP